MWSHIDRVTNSNSYHRSILFTCTGKMILPIFFSKIRKKKTLVVGRPEFIGGEFKYTISGYGNIFKRISSHVLHRVFLQIIFKRFDSYIVHNSRMKEYLIQKTDKNIYILPYAIPETK